MPDNNETTQTNTAGQRKLIIVACVAVIAIVALIAIVLWTRRAPSTHVNAETTPAAEQHEGEEVKLSPEALQSAGIEIEGVTQRPAIALLHTTGTVEANEQQTQQATPLVGGRIDQVHVRLGDRVRAGAVLAVISSPQIAQMHGKLHEAETQRALAERNLERVLRAENRVAVLSAKAKLDEAEATLKRVRRLIELGAGAGKDLIAAEAAYKTAKAEYDFQSNISLNREVQEARAAVETTRVDVSHIRDEMRSLGAPVPEDERHNHNKDTSLVALRAPVSGTVIERLVNTGAGVEAGTPLFTIGNLSTVWIIANVPEAQVGRVHLGTSVEVTSTAAAGEALSGRVAYIDPKLNEETRTARVRIEISNPGERLKAGMFVQVGFQTGAAESPDQELVVKSEALQRLGERTVVFVPKDDEPGVFEVRDVQAGAETNGYTRILNGLQLGDKVVTKGSFTLKTQLIKGELGDHDH
ncbi:MAG TPA: efflux RND transporter periplasmic adaptor subunit [Pyrinomonadaceae bacterium]|nr:efflux RND transporter periplasmic adaptor subunit [Pyrinomonadaceae bacterium]